MKLEFAIILYDSRSGSTLLSSLLDEYSCLLVSAESDYPLRISRYSKNTFKNESELIQLFEELSQEIQFRELNINIKDVIDELICERKKFNINKRDILLKIVEHYFKGSNEELENKTIVFKIPNAHYYLSHLKDVLGEYHVINLVRDGRAVFASKKKTLTLDGTVMDPSVVNAALNWRKKVSINLVHYHHLVIKYEELIAQSDLILTQIISFLEIKNFNKKEQSTYNKRIGKRQKSLHTNIESSLLQSRITRWKKELTKSEILVFDYIARRSLMKYYPNSIYQTAKKPRLIFVLPWFIFQYFIIKLKNIVKSGLNGDLLSKIKLKIESAKTTVNP